MVQILLIALGVVALPSMAKLALAFVELLVKLVAGGVVVGGALYLLVSFMLHGHPL